MSETHAKAMRQLENRVAAIEYENKDLSEKKHRNEAAIQRLSEQLSLAQDENSRLKTEVSLSREIICQILLHSLVLPLKVKTIRNEQTKLDTNIHQRDRITSQLQTKLTLAEQEVIRYQSELARQKELSAVLSEQKAKLDQDLTEKTALVRKREISVKSVSQELVKANEIIKKFQSQVLNEHSKVKSNERALQEQEKLLSCKNEELNTLREELKTATDKVTDLNQQKSDLETKCHKLEEEVSALEKKLKTNETVINWLNKQLTTAQARDPGFKIAPPPEGVMTFTPSGIGASSTPIVPNSRLKVGNRPRLQVEETPRSTLGKEK